MSLQELQFNTPRCIFLADHPPPRECEPVGIFPNVFFSYHKIIQRSDEDHTDHDEIGISVLNLATEELRHIPLDVSFPVKPNGSCESKRKVKLQSVTRGNEIFLIIESPFSEGDADDYSWGTRNVLLSLNTRGIERSRYRPRWSVYSARVAAPYLTEQVLDGATESALPFVSSAECELAFLEEKMAVCTDATPYHLDDWTPESHCDFFIEGAFKQRRWPSLGGDELKYSILGEVYHHEDDTALVEELGRRYDPESSLLFYHTYTINPEDRFIPHVTPVAVLDNYTGQIRTLLKDHYGPTPSYLSTSVGQLFLFRKQLMVLFMGCIDDEHTFIVLDMIR